VQTGRPHHAVWVIAVGDFRLLLLAICG
jgi:hypothetical protein